MREADERFLGGFGRAQIDGGECKRHRRVAAIILLGDRGINELQHIFCRDFNFGVLDIVRTGRPHAEAFPVLDNLDAGQTVGDNEGADPRLNLIGMCPDEKMGEAIGTRYEALAARDRPAICRPVRTRGRQSAAGRRPQLWFHTRGVQKKRLLLCL